MEYTVISADNHILEPRDLFLTRLPNEYRDRAPRVIAGADGGDGWSWTGKPPQRTFGIEAVAGRGSRISGFKWEDILPGNYDGKAHLADMRSDGIDAAVLYASTANGSYVNEDRPFALACMRAYNDWLLEDFCAVDPKRLIGVCLFPVDDGIDAALAEFERCLKKGAKVFFLPAYPAKHAYTDKYYDPIWQAASEAGVPLDFHRTSGGTPPPGTGFQPNIPGVNVGGTVVRFFSSVDTLTYMIYTGVFERFPKLKIVAAEVNCGWIPFWKQTMDQCYQTQKGWAKIPLERNPSEFLGKNVFAATLDDDIGFELMKKDKQLVDMTMFSIDYPHSVCLWPNSGKHVAKLTAGFSAEDKRKVLAGNAIKVYNLQ